MSAYRVMRLIVIYDLPTQDDDLKNLYTDFRRNLIKTGFMMIQYSIYCKIYPNHMALKKGMDKIRLIAPQIGNIRMFYITEKQWEDIEIISGNKQIGEKYINSERYIEI